MHSAAASIWARIELLYSSFKVCIYYVFFKSIEFVSYRFVHKFLITLQANKLPVITSGCNCLFFFYFYVDLNLSFAETIICLEDASSKKEYVSQFIVLFIHILLMSIESNSAFPLFRQT